MIEVHRLSKKFDQRGIAGVHDLSLTVQTGEVFALLGPNGSGKTSLLNLIARKVVPDSGEIKVTGTAQLATFLEPDREMNVQSYLINSNHLQITEDKKIQLARDMADIFEFTFQLRQKFGELSSGQKQKVLLASQLLNSPEVILLDEPFGHLDPFTRKDILSSLFDFIKQRSMTVIWVTHEIDEAFQFSDRVGLMNFGNLVQIGLPHELVFQPKNLFVARFFGHRNILAVKAQSTHCWQTPWGEWNFDYPGTEALMVIPQHAWRKSVDQSHQVKVLSRRIATQIWEYEVSFNERTYTVSLPDSEARALGTLALVPHWPDCFLIPL